MFDICFREQHEKFITAITEDDVVFPQTFDEKTHRSLKHPIPGDMTMPIIDLFKIIKIHDSQYTIIPATAGTFMLFVYHE